MLREATGFKHIYLATGRTDLRKGQDSLLMLIKNEFELDPFEPGNIFLFCGRRNHVIKALVFENDGFVLLTKRLIRGHYQWPRNRRETLDISEEQYHDLLDGFAVESRSTIEKIDRSLISLLKTLLVKYNTPHNTSNHLLNIRPIPLLEIKPNKQRKQIRYYNT